MFARRVTLFVAMFAVVLVSGCAGGTTTGSTPAATASRTVSQTGVPDTSSSTDTSAPAGAPAASDAAPIDATCPSANTTPFAKTKFVAHAGLAFGAFHRYLYTPYRDGSFRSGQKGRVTAFAKGALAALFIKREIRLASEDVKANPTLCNAIAAPLAEVGNSISGALDKLKSGDASGITAAESTVGGIESKTGNAGVPITDQVCGGDPRNVGKHSQR